MSEETQKMHCHHCSRHDSCESEKKKERSEKEVKRMLNRLSRIEGQVRGMKKMVEENRYCIDILIQAEAVSAAINAFNTELMAEHIRTCVAENIKAGNDEVVEELVKTLQRLMK